MNRYLVQYSENNQWVKFMIIADDIYQALDWAQKNVQETGVAVFPCH